MTPNQQNAVTAKLAEYRFDLKQLSNGLDQQAKSQNRENYTLNQLLIEYYDLVGKKLQTFKQWKEQNYSIRKGEHAFHLWDKPKPTKDGKTYYPIAFLFSQDQVYLNNRATA